VSDDGPPAPLLTPNFLSKGGWPKREYDSAFTREILEDSKLFLPVWHGVSPADVFEYSPILMDRLGLQWSLGTDEVARRLFKKVGSESGATFHELT
jgi:hypothetical protein